MLGDTGSRTLPPRTHRPHTQEQACAREPTDQNGRDWSVEIGHGDRSGDPKADDPSCERAKTIFRREPMQFGDCSNGDRDPEDAADEGSGVEPRLPCSTAKGGAEHGADAGQSPRGEECWDRFQEPALLPGRVFAQRIRPGLLFTATRGALPWSNSP